MSLSVQNLSHCPSRDTRVAQWWWTDHLEAKGGLEIPSVGSSTTMCPIQSRFSCHFCTCPYTYGVNYKSGCVFVVVSVYILTVLKASRSEAKLLCYLNNCLQARLTERRNNRWSERQVLETEQASLRRHCTSQISKDFMTRVDEETFQPEHQQITVNVRLRYGHIPYTSN